MNKLGVFMFNNDTPPITSPSNSLPIEPKGIEGGKKGKKTKVKTGQTEPIGEKDQKVVQVKKNIQKDNDPSGRRATLRKIQTSPSLLSSENVKGVNPENLQKKSSTLNFAGVKKFTSFLRHEKEERSHSLLSPRSKKTEKETEKELEKTPENLFSAKTSEWSNTTRKSKNASFGKAEAKELHKDIAEFLKHGSDFKIAEVIQFRAALQTQCQKPNVAKFYLNNSNKMNSLIELQKNLFELQESKLTETKGDKADSNSLEVLEQFCDVKRQSLVTAVTSKKHYQALVDNVATEVNERTLSAFKSVDLEKSIAEGKTDFPEIERNSDSISYFVLNTVLSVDDPKKRAMMFTFFVDVAENLLEEKGDHSSFKAIIGMLFNSNVERTVIIKGVPLLTEEVLQKYTQLNDLFVGNFGARKLAEKATKQQDLPTFMLDFSQLGKSLIMLKEAKRLAEADNSKEQRAEEQIAEEQIAEEQRAEEQIAEEQRAEEQRAKVNKLMEMPLLISERINDRNSAAPGAFTDLISLETFNEEKSEKRSRNLMSKAQKKLG